MNEIAIVVAFGFVTLCACGIFATRAYVGKRNQKALRQRLETMVGSSLPQSLPAARLSEEPGGITSALEGQPVYKHISNLLLQAGVPKSTLEFLQLSCLLFLAPLLICLVADLPLIAAALLSPLLGLAPYMVLRAAADKRRDKFQSQLPDAIDLMVSILKSGHSVPRAIRSVAEEMPEPCGTEFSEVSNRMTLGQNLSDALSRSVERFSSFELDMLRRAAAIQLEVGGSLCDLLEKTNSTLRQRIKLKSQVAVLTAQSRLSAWVIGLMPLLVVTGFQILNPDYISPLTDSNIGKALLFAAAAAMVTGIIVMRKLSTIRV